MLEGAAAILTTDEELYSMGIVGGDDHRGADRCRVQLLKKDII